MKKKVFGIATTVVAVAAIIILWAFYPWVDSPYNKERDLPILYRQITEYLTENWLIKRGLIHQTEGEVALFDLYKVDLSEEQREEILEYLEKKYPPVNFNEPVQMESDRYQAGLPPVFEIRKLYWKEERGWYYMNVRCILYSPSVTTDFKLSYVFHNGQWNFLEESKVTYADYEWYDQHVQE